ncbi:hypothetical protein TVAG_343690 [Trichomonas vaginalis G3]|uniref:SH3 domain-containing protein n=1 Tax=Trichomonas vaginalis (strain ATCC PRA-98 / G3) TaxID=412133 RepID=A2E1H3_TRIV3|nr:hypothetical protein TVAGG3_0319520 [Trichomonas vaginalis G3]EAY13540.1 hypothetical protein TVAG_343690 [Trichomonas vaginalis G3]KAI5529184.1 hypothetical protein TVAGG3_0319520 [Trichomonas vaginalis G3]|eukprot:XP_001325763.1 hypothetical protein [Trichomonas vaginalis G3]
MSKKPYDDYCFAMIKDLKSKKELCESVAETLDILTQILMEFNGSRSLNGAIDSSDTHKSSEIQQVHDWIQVNIIQGTAFKLIVKEYETNAKVPLIKLQNDIGVVIDNAEEGIEQANLRLDLTESEYKNLYDEYIETCHMIENETDISKVEELKVKCSELEQRCIDFTLLLGKARRQYCFEIEALFEPYETILDQYSDVMQNLLDKLPIINKVFTDHFKSHPIKSDMLSQIFLSGPLPATKCPSKLSRLQFITPAAEIEFNIFDYIQPNVVYDISLTQAVYELTENYHDPNQAWTVRKGDYVNCIDKKGNMYHVEHVGSGLRGQIPKNILVKSKYKRTIKKLNSNYEEKGVKYQAGFCMCICKENKDNYTCVTPSQTFVHIPKKLLA